MEEIDLTQGFELANEAIEKCLNQVGEEIYHIDIKFRARGFGVLTVLDLMFAVVEQKFIRLDPGNPETDFELPEPTPPNTETWMRSSIPVHKRFTSPTLNPDQTPQLERKNSFKTGYNRTNTYQRLKKKPSKIFEEPTAFPMEIVKVELSHDEEFLRLKKEREWKRKLDELSRLKNLENEDKKKRKMLARQLGGKLKNYTYDYNGKILMITPPECDQEIFEQVRYKVGVEVVEEKPKSLPRTAQSGNFVVKKRVLEPIQEKGVKQVHSLAILEHLRLAPGVSIGNSNRTVPASRGGEIPQAKFTHRSPEIVISKPPEQIVGGSHSTKLIKTVSEAALVLPTVSEKEIKGRKEKTFKKKLLPITYDSKTNQVKHYSKDMSTENLSAYDKFNLAILSNRDWGKNPPMQSVKISARVPKVASPKDQYEVYGYLAKKPKDEPFISAEELWEISSGLKKPRDRAYIEKVQTKTKQPPPPLGKTMLISFNGV